MGLYDREYYREEPKGLFLGGPTSMVGNLVLVNVVVFILDAVLAHRERLPGGGSINVGPISALFALDADLIHQPWMAWQLLTYGFVHSVEDIFHVGFNMLFLWFFGREVETIYGRKPFLQLYLSLVMLSGLCWLATENLMLKDYSAHMVGASGAVFGVMLVFAVHFPMRLIYIFGILPVPVWLLVAFYVVQDLLGFRRAVHGPDGGDPIAHAAHLGGAAFGFVFYKTRWTLFSILPSGRWLKRSLKGRPRLRLHRPEDAERELNERVDQILEKISREGESSLTRAERRILEDASRRYQQRRR
jgi:membrane associated rhomboid family serine protease